MELGERNVALKTLYSSQTAAEKAEWAAKAQNLDCVESGPEVVKKLTLQIQSQVNYDLLK